MPRIVQRLRLTKHRLLLCQGPLAQTLQGSHNVCLPPCMDHKSVGPHHTEMRPGSVAARKTINQFAHFGFLGSTCPTSHRSPLTLASRLFRVLLSGHDPDFKWSWDCKCDRWVCKCDRWVVGGPFGRLAPGHPGILPAFPVTQSGKSSPCELDSNVWHACIRLSRGVMKRYRYSAPPP